MRGFLPAGTARGMPRGGGGGTRKGRVLTRRSSRLHLFLFVSLLLYIFAIALENVGREETGEVLLQRPWGLGFFHAEIV